MKGGGDEVYRGGRAKRKGEEGGPDGRVRREGWVRRESKEGGWGVRWGESRQVLYIIVIFLWGYSSVLWLVSSVKVTLFHNITKLIFIEHKNPGRALNLMCFNKKVKTTVLMILLYCLLFSSYFISNFPLLYLVKTIN